MLKKTSYFLFSTLLFTATSLAAGMPPPSVDVITVKMSELKPTIDAAGTFKAEHGVTIRTEIPGKITQVFFKSGDMVKQNDKLIELNNEISSAQLKSFQADLQLSKVDFERTNKLHQKNLMSTADYDKAMARVASDQAHVDEAQARFNQSIIKAPFAGRVGLVQINMGDYVNAGDKITDLEDDDPIYIDFNLPETYLSKIQIGQDVSVKSDVAPQKEFKGKIIAKDIIANPETRSVVMRASVPNPKGEMIPGTFATLTIYQPAEDNTIKLPHSAISYSPAGNFVYRVVNGNAEKVVVTLGHSDNETVVVTSGLKENDKIIINGIDKVQPGAPVQINKSLNKPS